MKKKTEKQIIGALGEDIACRYLESKGYTVFTRNYWRPWGEIDIVVEKEGKTHFVEVKAVSRETLEVGSGYRPEDNMHPWKLERLGRVIQTYISEKGTQEWQFDVLTVLIDQKGKRAKVERLENVVL